MPGTEAASSAGEDLAPLAGGEDFFPADAAPVAICDGEIVQFCIYSSFHN